MYIKKPTRVTFKSNRRPNFKRNNNFTNGKPRNKGNVSQQYNKYLKLAKGSVKIAVIMKIKHLNYDNAEIMLNNNEGDLNKILKNS